MSDASGMQLNSEAYLLTVFVLRTKNLCENIAIVLYNEYKNHIGHN